MKIIKIMKFILFSYLQSVNGWHLRNAWNLQGGTDPYPGNLLEGNTIGNRPFLGKVDSNIIPSIVRKTVAKQPIPKDSMKAEKFLPKNAPMPVVKQDEKKAAGCCQTDNESKVSLHVNTYETQQSEEDSSKQKGETHTSETKVFKDVHMTGVSVSDIYVSRVKEDSIRDNGNTPAKKVEEPAEQGKVKAEDYKTTNEQIKKHADEDSPYLEDVRKEEAVLRDGLKTVEGVAALTPTSFSRLHEQQVDQIIKPAVMLHDNKKHWKNIQASDGLHYYPKQNPYLEGFTLAKLKELSENQLYALTSSWSLIVPLNFQVMVGVPIGEPDENGNPREAGDFSMLYVIEELKKARRDPNSVNAWKNANDQERPYSIVIKMLTMIGWIHEVLAYNYRNTWDAAGWFFVPTFGACSGCGCRHPVEAQQDRKNESKSIREFLESTSIPFCGWEVGRKNDAVPNKDSKQVDNAQGEPSTDDSHPGAFQQYITRSQSNGSCASVCKYVWAWFEILFIPRKMTILCDGNEKMSVPILFYVAVGIWIYNSCFIRPFWKWQEIIIYRAPADYGCVADFMLKYTVLPWTLPCINHTIAAVLDLWPNYVAKESSDFFCGHIGYDVDTSCYCCCIESQLCCYQLLWISCWCKGCRGCCRTTKNDLCMFCCKVLTARICCDIKFDTERPKRNSKGMRFEIK